jgi:hypothetical protein
MHMSESYARVGRDMPMWGQPPSAVLRAKLDGLDFLCGWQTADWCLGFVSGYAFRHTDDAALSVAPLGAAARGPPGTV